MTISSLGTLGATGVNSAGTDLAHTTVTTALADGDSVIAIFETVGSGTTTGATTEHTSVSGGSITWTKLDEWYNSTGTTSQGAMLSLWLGTVTGTVSVGTVLTFTRSPSKNPKCVSAWAFRSDNPLELVGTPSRLTGNAATWPSDTISGLSSGEYLFVRALGKDGAGSTTNITPSAGFAAFDAIRSHNGSSATAALIRGEWDILTGTTATSAPTGGNVTANYTTIFVALREQGTPAPTLDDVDTDNAVIAGQANVTVNGADLTGATAFKIKTGTKSCDCNIDSASGATMQVDIPSMATLKTAGIKFGACTFEVTTPGGTDTVSGTIGVSAGYAVHDVTDISRASEAGCEYNGQSPAVAVGDQSTYETTTALYGWDTDIDTQGIVSADSGGDNRTDSFAYDLFDGTDETWGAAEDWEFTTVPELFGAAGTATGQDTADVSVSTNVEEGTIWCVVTTSATTPSHAQIKAGQTHTGAAAVFAGSDTSPTASTEFAANGLSIGPVYFPHFTQENESAEPDAAVPVTGGGFVLSTPMETLPFVMAMCSTLAMLPASEPAHH